jgi:hypothetical protein
MGPWSKLERRLRELPDPTLDLRFRFTAYRYKVIETPHPSELTCKFWITRGRRTLWAVPRDRHVGDANGDIGGYGRRSPGWLVELCVEYMQQPRTRLLAWRPGWDGWGLVDLLKACDRRIGRRQWSSLRQQLQEPVALWLLDQRSGRTSLAPRTAGRDSDQLWNQD